MLRVSHTGCDTQLAMDVANGFGIHVAQMPLWAEEVISQNIHASAENHDVTVTHKDNVAVSQDRRSTVIIGSTNVGHQGLAYNLVDLFSLHGGKIREF